VIEFSAFGASLFKPNSIGPFTDALFDHAHQSPARRLPSWRP
jgi:hypothetical protein